MNENTSRRNLLAFVMAAVGVWGILLSLGALLFGVDAETGSVTVSVSPMRGAITLTCVVLFMGLWASALFVRGWNQRRPQGAPTRLAGAPRSEGDASNCPPERADAARSIAENKNGGAEG